MVGQDVDADGSPSTASPARTMLSHVPLNVRLVYQRRAGDPGGCVVRVDGDSDAPWELAGVLPADVESVSGADDEDAWHVSGPIVLTLDRDEADGYYLNLTSPQPSLFALLRQGDVASATPNASAREVPQAVAITASYTEASRWMDGGMIVVRTPLPEPLRAWIAEFAQHHFPVEGPKKRGKYRPSFLSRQEFGQKAKAALSDLERTTQPQPVDKGP